MEDPVPIVANDALTSVYPDGLAPVSTAVGPDPQAGGFQTGGMRVGDPDQPGMIVGDHPAGPVDVSELHIPLPDDFRMVVYSDAHQLRRIEAMLGALAADIVEIKRHMIEQRMETP